MLSRLKSLFNRGRRHSEFGSPLFDDEILKCLQSPEDPHDVEAWDRYSVTQAQFGFAPGLYDMMIDDRDLVRVMNEEGMCNVLCAGCGVSREPRVLAEAGFQVGALDISPRAIDITRALDFSSEVFEEFCETDMRQEGGRIEHVVGDIFDEEICPSPFDVIVERRTAQLFSGEELQRVMRALTSRLSTSGIFVSHCHDGGWRPPEMPRHFTQTWFEENGWTIWFGAPRKKALERVAWLFITTG